MRRLTRHCAAFLSATEQEAKNEADMTTATVIKIYAKMPPIAKLDNSLNNLSACEPVRLSQPHEGTGRA